jgi:transposase InsO family protein
MIFSTDFAMSISDEEILKLWRDPTFAGSYRGAKTFQTLLKTDLNIDVSEKRILNALKTDPLFLIHQTPKRHFKRRQYNVHFYGELVQADIAFMFSDSETKQKYFLLVIDVFSFKIFTRALKDRSSASVAKALNDIVEEFKEPIYEIQSDQGREFLGKDVRHLLKKNKIFLKFKYGKNKANFAEHAIYLVKRKLYLTLRGLLSQRWEEYLPTVTKSLNQTPLKRLGWLTPDSVTNQVGSVAVDKARKAIGLPTNEEPTYTEKVANQKEYKGDLKVGDYVYLDFNEKVFDKSFDVSVRKSMFKSLILKILSNLLKQCLQSKVASFS